MELNSKRIIDLALRYLGENSRSILKVLIANSSVILVISLLGHIGEYKVNYDVFVILFYIFMFIGGFWFSGSIFKEIHNPSKAYRYLTLPASNLEKLVNAWVITSLLVIIVSYIVINLTSWLMILISSLWMEPGFEMLDLFNNYNFGKRALLYTVIQTIFLFGSVLFRKLNFFNTIIWIMIAGVGIGIITSLFGLLIFYPAKDFNFGDDFWKFTEIGYFFENRFAPAMEYLFWYAMAPFFMVCSYFRLKETEIS